MPEISRFFGIVIRMYHRDHVPPHFHARYGEYRAKFDIEAGALLEGRMPRRALALVEESHSPSQRIEGGLETGPKSGATEQDRTPGVTSMIPRVIDARHAGKYRVWLRFDDGLTGEIDLKDELWGPVFDPLKDVAEFAKLRADPEADTVVWPNGADLAPEFLYDRLKAMLAGRDAAE